MTPTVTRADDGTLSIDWHGNDRPRVIEITPEALTGLIDEINRFRGHSVILNSVAWGISVALGDVGPDDTHHVSTEGVLADFERFLAHSVRVEPDAAVISVAGGKVKVESTYFEIVPGMTRRDVLLCVANALDEELLK